MGVRNESRYSIVDNVSIRSESWCYMFKKDREWSVTWDTHAFGTLKNTLNGLERAASRITAFCEGYALAIGSILLETPANIEKRIAVFDVEDNVLGSEGCRRAVTITLVIVGPSNRCIRLGPFGEAKARIYSKDKPVGDNSVEGIGMGGGDSGLLVRDHVPSEGFTSILDRLPSLAFVENNCDGGGVATADIQGWASDTTAGIELAGSAKILHDGAT